MRRFLFILVATLSTMLLQAQTLEQTFYFDFGANDGTKGDITNNPDANNNHWNNPTDPLVTAAPITLVNSDSIISRYTFLVTSKFNVNGKTGGGGPTSTSLPLDLAIQTATQDYFFVEGTGHTSAFKITNLSLGKGYKFHIFGSRSATGDRIAQFTITGLSTTGGTHQTSGTNLGGTGIHLNNSTILVSECIYPAPNGEITIEVARATGSYAHINVMKMEEYGDMPALNIPTSITLGGENITTPGQSTQMQAQIDPADAINPGITWSVDKTSIAWIDAEGVLHPKANGTVEVTGTITYDGTTISGTKTINISNQIATLYFAGSASEAGDGLENAIAMTPLSDLNGTTSGVFRVYTSLSATGTFGFYTSTNPQEGIAYGGSEGALAADGNAIPSSISGPVSITVDLTKNTYTIMPVSLRLVGSATPGGWTLSPGISLPYQGNGVWSGQVTLTGGGSTSTDRARFVIATDNSWNYVFKQVSGSDNSLMIESVAKQYGITLSDVLTNFNGGDYHISIDLRNYTYSISCADISEYKISMMGSSVANGQGATDMQGYAWMYNHLLDQRYQDGAGAPWMLSNISVNGNNTTKLLERWERDFISDCSRYVIYGLSLGNEGIHENGQSSFDSYRDNMQLLISKTREAGKIPVMSNSYTRTDFTATDYAYIKAMNLLIHEWDLPSSNLLGAIDNGSGQWADGYQVVNDIYHPITEGHAEFFHAMVPSLFDALEADKPQPQRVSTTSYTTGRGQKRIRLIPENGLVHPFTISFDVKTAGTGTIASFVTPRGLGTLAVQENGTLVYNSPATGNIATTSAINTNQWQRVTLSHYYAQGRTLLYLNSTLVGELNERMAATVFYLNDFNAPEEVTYRELFFYRSAMNPGEIAALCEGRMLKSSLEIYTPLDDSAAEPFENLAQSMNAVSLPSNEIPASVVTSLPANSLQTAKTLILLEDYNTIHLQALQQALGNNVVITSLDFKGTVANDDVNYFEGINPNCLKYIAGSTAPAKWTNVVSGTIALSPITLTDREPFACPAGITASTGGVSYTRLCYTDGGWETIILPFAVTGFEHQANFRIEGYSSENDTKVYFNLLNDIADWQANQAYIMSHRTNIGGTQSCTFTAGEGALIQTLPEASPFSGTYTGVSAGDITGKYILLEDGMAFGRATANATVPPFRAWLDANLLPGGAEAPTHFVIEHGDGTGIEVNNKPLPRLVYASGNDIIVISDKTQTIRVYGIDGSAIYTGRVEEGRNVLANMKRGMYLVWGEKVVVTD